MIDVSGWWETTRIRWTLCSGESKVMCILNRRVDTSDADCICRGTMTPGFVIVVTDTLLHLYLVHRYSVHVYLVLFTKYVCTSTLVLSTLD